MLFSYICLELPFIIASAIYGSKPPFFGDPSAGQSSHLEKFY